MRWRWTPPAEGQDGAAVAPVLARGFTPSAPRATHPATSMVGRRKESDADGIEGDAAPSDGDGTHGPSQAARCSLVQSVNRRIPPAQVRVIYRTFAHVSVSTIVMFAQSCLIFALTVIMTIVAFILSCQHAWEGLILLKL